MKQTFKKTKALIDKPFHYCPGCTHGIIHRILGEVLEELNLLEKTIGVAPVGCSGFMEQYFNIDFQCGAHGRAPAIATGIKRSLPEKIVFTYQGDGDMASIGIAEAIHAAARGEKFTSIFVNNGIYGMTGGQMAPTSLIGQKTATSPYGRDADLAGFPLDLPLMMSTIRGAAYVASVSVDTPENVMKAKRAIKKAFKVQLAGLGFSFVSVLSTCPTNWGLSPTESLKWLQDHLGSYYTLGELKTPEMAKA
ncbi:thiamine pyrophosphate-dependent enzyme [Neobacillus sp.]|uniref:thiamine pyrophosphate-dependent enzyme n=1 Tax=Neobacillus sp. TaxID=2675273 RepID=UPI0028A0C03E|nr:thiamine pyrophosphate-dependent enzyme [Neobacillus sp.]